jgi:hypothetical protein
VALQLDLATLQGVQIVAERQRRGHIHRQRRELARDVDAASVPRRVRQAPVETLRGGGDDVKIALQVV